MYRLCVLKIITHKGGLKMTKKLRKDRVFGLLLILVLVVAFVFRAPIIDGVKGLMPEKTVTNDAAAKVNGVEISTIMLNEKFAQLPEQYKEMVSKESILDQMITEELLLQQVKDVKVSDEEIQKAVEELLEANAMTKDDLEKALKEQGLTLEELKDTYRKQIAISNYINQTLFKDISVSDSDIEDYFEKQEDSFAPKEGQVRAAHILVESEKDAKKVLIDLEDTNFDTVAKDTSVGPSAKYGGSLGYVSKGQLVKEFEAVLFALDENEVSEPVETQYGWHVIKRLSDNIELDEVKNDIKATIMEEKQKTVYETYLKQLRSNADVEIFIGEQVDKKVGTVTLEKCLKNAKVYVADGCKYCDKQKETLGKTKVTIVDCSKEVCTGVKGFPTWEVDGKLIPGYKTEKELKELANC